MNLSRISIRAFYYLSLKWLRINYRHAMLHSIRVGCGIDLCVVEIVAGNPYA